MPLNPLTTRLSEHFLLSDFLGCASIYARGIPNVFDKRSGHDIRLDNGKALCENILEPIIETWGPVSVSYGFISPEASRQIVTYQDPNKPSYHRWDAGAAADILIHDICGKDRNDLLSSPIYAAHKIDHSLNLPYSRLITYSESPYLCIAARHWEIEAWKEGGDTRRAFYENRYPGRKGAKPEYINMRSDKAKEAAYRALKQSHAEGKPFPWKGVGYPTYHGGGQRQLHHIRVSKYTMVTDWLFDAESIMSGHRNNPCLNNEEVKHAFCAAGAVYDRLLLETMAPRYSIVQGYIAPHNPRLKGENPLFDWRSDRIGFVIVPPNDRWDDGEFDDIPYTAMERALPGVRIEGTDNGVLFSFEVKDVIQSKEWEPYRAHRGLDL